MISVLEEREFIYIAIFCIPFSLHMHVLLKTNVNLSIKVNKNPICVMFDDYNRIEINYKNK